MYNLTGLTNLPFKMFFTLHACVWLEVSHVGSHVVAQSWGAGEHLVTTLPWTDQHAVPGHARHTPTTLLHLHEFLHAFRQHMRSLGL